MILTALGQIPAYLMHTPKCGTLLKNQDSWR
jgi:hypothetical protein